MKKLYFFVAILLLSVSMMAQTSQGELKEYDRNALATILVFHPEDEFGNDIFDAFIVMPTPDKYDDHSIYFNTIDNSTIKGVMKKKYGLYKAKHGKVLTSKEIQKNADKIEELINKAECGKHMVAKWFNLKGDSLHTSTFDMSLIGARGQYNATDIDVAIANQTARGSALLSDMGEELIGNTYLLVNDITYVTAEERAAAAKKAMSVIGGILGGLGMGDLGKSVSGVTNLVADAFTGFTVKTHSYLYQLQWNDSIASIFYNDYYTAEPNEEKITRFLDDTTSFKLKYVAHEYEFDEKSTLKGKYDRKELVKMVCTRSIDKNIAALQLQYEDFKVKTPVYSIEYNDKGKVVGYNIKIGLKEGITEKSKFQVVEKRLDPETNRTTYKYVATIKPEKGKIWDNRYNAVEEQAEGADRSYTTFKKVSGGEILPGMLSIEGKYRKVKEE